MAEGDRLQKVLAQAGVASRREVEDLIRQGRVAVEGSIARLGQRIDPTKQKVEVDGYPVPLDVRSRYYLLHKPVGVVTTARDPQGRATVLDLVDPAERVWPVGRLDVDTAGALILTNDGELTHRLTHPRFEVAKTYVAEVSGAPAPAALRALRRGVELDDGPSRPARVRLIDSAPHRSVVELTIREGRNRQVRRILEAVGHPVVHLVRTAIGPVSLGRLKPGTARRLAPAEVRALYEAASRGAKGRQADKATRI